MPYSEKQIRNLVKQGVRAELKKGRKTRKEIVDLVVQGVPKELKDPDTGIARDLQLLIDHLPAPPRTAPMTGDGAAVNAGGNAAARPA